MLSDEEKGEARRSEGRQEGKQYVENTLRAKEAQAGAGGKSAAKPRPSFRRG